MKTLKCGDKASQIAAYTEFCPSRSRVALAKRLLTAVENELKLRVAF